MWSMINSAGVATVTMDFTNDMALLGYGLFGLVALSAGMIIFAAIQEYRRPVTAMKAAPEFVAEEYREAA
ncbi:MAG: hypothetical protein AB7G75_12075 [Candidatus Binatia bacterium]